MGTTPEQAMEKIHDRFGAHDGHRALHAKGIHCTGTFTPTPEAAKLTRAGHMNAAVSAKVRFSNGGGDPTVPDYAPDVRGLAVSFQLPDGSATDILAQTLPRFPFPDQEGFFAALAVSERNLGTLLKLPGFLAALPGRAEGASRGGRRGQPARELRRPPLLPLPRVQVARRRRRRALRPLLLAPDRRRARPLEGGGQEPRARLAVRRAARAPRARARPDAPRGPDRRRGRRPGRPLRPVARRPRAGHRRHARGHRDRRRGRRRDRLRPDAIWSTESRPRTTPCCATGPTFTPSRTPAARAPDRPKSAHDPLLTSSHPAAIV